MFKLSALNLPRISAVVAGPLALALLAGCNRDPNVQKEKYLESGKRYEDAGKYKEAAIQFSNALKVDKSFAAAHYELAKTEMMLGNPMFAYSELSKTVDLNPLDLKARVDLGNLLLSGHAPDRAAVQAKAVLAIDANNAGAYALLAGIAQYNQDHAEALKNIRQAISLSPNTSSYHSELALMEAADPTTSADAEQELNKAASLDTKSATPHVLLGSLLVRKGDMQGAETQYKAAIAAAPKNIQARQALAALYVRTGDKSKAEDVLHKAVEDNPDDEVASSMLVEYDNASGQMDRAESTFADLTSKYPKSVPIKITYARELIEKKEYSKATPIVAQLTKSEGNNAEVQTLNALLLVNQGKTDEAFTLLKKAGKDNRTDFTTQLLLGRIAASKGDDATAQSSFQDAARLRPASIDAAAGLASLAIKRNDAGALHEVADTMIQAHANNPVGYLWRGMAEGNQKHYDKAEADFQTVLKMNPNDAAAYVELGQVHLIQGHFPEGDAMLEKALEKDPNAIRALALLVTDDLRKKQPEKAIERIQAQIAKSPSNPAYYSQLALVQLETRDFQGAITNSQKTLQLDPANGVALETFTQAETALGNIDPAVSAWQNWMSAHPNDAIAPQMLGSLEETKGDIAKAMDYYKKALQLDPNDAVAANNLAYLTVGTGGNVDTALTLAQTARRLLPNSPQTADTLAWVYYFKGDYGEARLLLEQALKAAPNDPSMHFHLGMTYGKLNDKANSELHLKKAVALAPDSKPGKDANEALKKLS